MTRPLALLLTLALLPGACERKISDRPPPLRPLVYTEAPDDTGEPLEDEGAQAIRYITPEDLGVAVFQSLVEHDRELFESVFITGPELVDLINLRPVEKANAESAAMLTGSEEVWSHFTPTTTSEAPVGGLTSRFMLLEFSVGKGRDISGRTARPGVDEVVQHWGNDLRVQLRNTEKVFTVRVPKIVYTGTTWRVAQPLEMSPTLRMYLQAGMHLQDNLLTPQHYPFPLVAGNYWKYRIKSETTTFRRELDRPLEPEEPTEDEDEESGEAETAEASAQEDGEEAGEDEEAPGGEAATSAAIEAESVGPPAEPTVLIELKEVHRRQGYLIASFVRTRKAEETEVERFHILATPRLFLPCTRDCRANIDDIAYLLGYMSQQTPLYVFPLPAGGGWSQAGRSSRRNRYNVELHDQPVEVKAGDFPRSLRIVGSISEGLETRYFVPNLGVIKRVVRAGVASHTEELIDSRTSF